VIGDQRRDGSQQQCFEYQAIMQNEVKAGQHSKLQYRN